MHGKSSSRTNSWNVAGAKEVEACDEAEVTQQSEVIGDKHEVKCETRPKHLPIKN